MRILKWGIGIILIGGLLYYLGFGIVYYFSMKKANNEAKVLSCDEQKNEYFVGKIGNVLRYEYSDFMNENFFELNIVPSDSTKNHISYQYDKKLNENLLEFVRKGQRVKKERGKSYFELISINGESKTFNVPDCEK